MDNSTSPKLNRTMLRGLHLLCECAENGLPADLALKRPGWKRYIEQLIDGPRPPLASRNIMRGIDILCDCARNGIPADLVTDTEWAKYIAPTIKWVYRQGSRLERSARPIITPELLLELKQKRRRFRKVTRAVKTRDGVWSLHLACGHRVVRESFSGGTIACQECALRSQAPEVKS